MDQREDSLQDWIDRNAVGPLDVVSDDGDVIGAVHARAGYVRMATPVGVEKKALE